MIYLLCRITSFVFFPAKKESYNRSNLACGLQVGKEEVGRKHVRSLIHLLNLSITCKIVNIWAELPSLSPAEGSRILIYSILIYTCGCVGVRIYIYIHRERERERESTCTQFLCLSIAFKN